MVQVSTNATVTLAAGASVTFNNVDLNTGGCTCYNQSRSSIKMTSRGIYQISFNANVSSATAALPVQLAIALGGTAVVQGTAISTPSTANALNSISRTIFVGNGCGDFNRVTLVNNGTNPITIAAGATLAVAKVR